MSNLLPNWFDAVRSTSKYAKNAILTNKNRDAVKMFKQLDADCEMILNNRYAHNDKHVSQDLYDAILRVYWLTVK